ncbi:lysozyme g-like isoform X2 [Rhinatrema bivittatum]|uniref:lysozyme g-like isoform X2 n=1 Tax=Rhinatrema bivittatum TaxID=194408 RepID=UPI00112B38C7|nr:lysozyme g-like isoform X2 [Rhinatrema bivittatum]
MQAKVSKRSAVKMFIGLLILCFATIIHVSEELGLYGDIMKVSTTGASCVTAKQNKLDHCGINASEKLAKADLERINKYKKQIKEVARKLLINAAVIAGVISRESRAGAVLDKGWGENDNTFGLMQIYKEGHTSTEAWNSTDHIYQGTQILVDMIEEIQKRFPLWTKEEQLKGGIAAFNAGPLHIKSYSEIDKNTSHHDYANDVVARAKFFKTHGY